MKFKELFESEGKNLIGFKINGKLVTSNTPSETWYSNFTCTNCQLTSLEGAPKSVIFGFYCDNNKLTSLKGAPEEVGGTFWCNNNKLTSLKGSPKKTGDFRCDSNLLTSLEGAPRKVDGSVYCDNNKITTFKDIHKHIKHISKSFYFDSENVKSHVLGLLLIDGLEKIRDSFADTLWVSIINKHLGEGRAGVLAAQQELIEAGLTELAQL